MPQIPARKLTRKGNEIKLSPKEFGLLELFLKRQGKINPDSVQSVSDPDHRVVMYRKVVGKKVCRAV